MSTDKPVDEAVKLVLKGLAEEHPLFRLYYLGFDAYLHQAELVYGLVLRRPIRALIADEVGLGKTIEALMVADWGLRKGIFPGGAVLALVPRSLVGQWAAEARKAGFNVILDPDAVGVQAPGAVRAREIYILKIDTVKQDKHKHKVLGRQWDLVIVDEAHKLGLDTDRLKLVEELLERNPSSSVLFLSATPHRGDEEQYLKLLRMLDPVDLAKLRGVGKSRYYRATLGSIVIRRSKVEVNNVYEERKVFVDAELLTKDVKLKDVERRYIERLDELTRRLLRSCRDERLRRAVGLVAIVIDKRGLSSFYSGLRTFERILERVRAPRPGAAAREVGDVLDLAAEYVEEDYLSMVDPDAVAGSIVEHEAILKLLGGFSKELGELRDLAEQALRQDSKLAQLGELVRKHLEGGDKVVVFTEYADTAEYIYRHLEGLRRAGALSFEARLLTGRHVGGPGAIEDVARWLSAEGPRVLVSTDVASEGLNLQHANVVVNFELPWSLTKLEQRAGRVWRIGQSKDVKIYLMVMDHGFEKVIFEALYRKLSESVVAGIVPSTLVAFRASTRGGVSLPLSAIADLESLGGGKGREGLRVTPFVVWLEYKEKGERGVKALVEESLERLKKLAEKLRELERFTGLYSTLGYGVPPSIPGGPEKSRLRRVVGFGSHAEVEEFLCRAAKLLGRSSCDEYSLRSALREAAAVEVQPLYLACDELKDFFAVLRACAGIDDRGSACWILGYRGGEERDAVKPLEEVLLFFEDLARRGSCTKIERGGIDATVAEDYAGERLSKARERVSAYVKSEVAPSLLRDLLMYVELKSKSLAPSRQHSLRPASIDEVKVSVDPLVVAVPRAEVSSRIRRIVEEEIVDTLEECVGSITREKLEVERRGVEALTKALSERFALTYVGDLMAPFDFVAKSRGTGEVRLVELKTLARRDIIVFTEGEVELARRLEEGGHEYWLYVVDLRRGEVRGYRWPFRSGRLRALASLSREGRSFYAYLEAGRADERIRVQGQPS